LERAVALTPAHTMYRDWRFLKATLPPVTGTGSRGRAAWAESPGAYGMHSKDAAQPSPCRRSESPRVGDRRWASGNRWAGAWTPSSVVSAELSRRRIGEVAAGSYLRA